MYTEAAVVAGRSEAVGTVPLAPLETVFHIHSDPDAPSDSYGHPSSYLTESVYMQKSILVQICQLILYISNDDG